MEKVSRDNKKIHIDLGLINYGQPRDFVLTLRSADGPANTPDKVTVRGCMSVKGTVIAADGVFSFGYGESDFGSGTDAGGEDARRSHAAVQGERKRRPHDGLGFDWRGCREGEASHRRGERPG